MWPTSTRSKAQGPTTLTSYYSPIMIAGAVEYASRCKACQIHADFIHQLPEILPVVTSWPFEAWRFDIVGPISPLTVQSHQFILAITDYFSKWAEAAPLPEVKTTNVINFIKHHVIHWFGVTGGSSTTMVPNLQANHSINFAINTGSRMWLQLLITLPPVG